MEQKITGVQTFQAAFSDLAHRDFGSVIAEAGQSHT
jgi:hypothetical protein